MRRFLRENSLSIFFLAALTGQAIAGHDLYNEETLRHGGDPISLWCMGVTRSPCGAT